VEFRTGLGEVDASFGDNAARLSELLSFIGHVRRDSTLMLTGVTFSGFASPDGRFAFNRELAAARLASLERMVRSRVDLPDSLVGRENGGIAWALLAELLEASDMPGREEALRVVREVPERTFDGRGRLADSRKKRLMDLRGGRVWREMDRRFFARLRRACAVLLTVERCPVATEKDTFVQAERVADPPDTVAVSPLPVALSPQPEGRRPFLMAVKTNLLCDALGVPTAGLEFALGEDWSAGGYWMYGWWNKDRRHRYWRVYGGAVVLRRWLGRKPAGRPLAGHHLGLYGQGFTYDFERGGRGYMGGRPGGTLWDELNYAAGVEYGYSLPVARRLNVDFSLGVGYWGGLYHIYIPLDGHYVWQATKKRRRFGPTQAEISLVWLLGQGGGKKGGGL